MKSRLSRSPRWPAWIAATASAVLGAGCSVSTNDSPAPSATPAATVDGTLVVDWTIDESKDPGQCSQGSVDSIDITVTSNGARVGEWQQSCTAFATSIPLAPGAYEADAVLIDANGAARTTVVPINPFTIHGNDQLTIPVDFPASSFK